MQLLSSDGCGWPGVLGWEVRGSGERLFKAGASVRGGPGGGAGSISSDRFSVVSSSEEAVSSGAAGAAASGEA